MKLCGSQKNKSMNEIADNIYRKARIGDAIFQRLVNLLLRVKYTSIFYRTVVSMAAVLIVMTVGSIALFNADSVYAEKLIAASILLLMLLLNRFLSSNQ